MVDPTPRNVRSVKSRLDTINQTEESTLKRMSTMNKVQSHFLVPSEKLDKVTRRVIAPYAQIERKGLKEEEARDSYLDISRFHVFLEDSVDLQALLCDTAAVLKTITDSSGVFVYIVDKLKNEIVLMTKNIKKPERHEVNIPIEEGKVAAAHVAATKRHLVLADVQRDRRFAQGLRWVDAKTALCVPVLKPDGDCYAVLELYKTIAEPYDDRAVYSCASVAWWAGAAAHQASARATLQRAAHLDIELRALLHDYFCERAALDTMLTDMLAIVKSFIGAMRSSFLIVDRQHMEQQLVADVWEDGWQSERTALPKKKAKLNLSVEQSPAGLVARTGAPLNLHDGFRDPRFLRDVDPTTGMVVRSSLTYPIKDKKGVIGVVQLVNKSSGRPFDAEDEQIFQVFVDHCALIVHFYHMQQHKLYHCHVSAQENLNRVYSELLGLHLKPCGHDLEELEANYAIVPPFNFKSFNYHISEGSREEMPALVCLMYSETFAAHKLERGRLADFVLTVLTCYRPNPYHNADHAFCFTHTMYLILRENPGYFSFVETAALMLAGLCHDLDHPGYNNNFLKLCKHPLAHMYTSSQLEHHHYFLAMKIIEDKKLLGKLEASERVAVLEEMRYDILCTDLAVYFALRAQLAPLVADRAFSWADTAHRRLLKGILMTTSDLSGCCKPFGVAKAITESIYEEFYNQGDRERGMGYTPLSMMDRKRRVNQPAEQIQFLSVVVLPCLLLLTNIFPNTSPLMDNCRETQEGWHEEIEMRGMRLWRQDDSTPPSRSRVLLKEDN